MCVVQVRKKVGFGFPLFGEYPCTADAIVNDCPRPGGTKLLHPADRQGIRDLNCQVAWGENSMRNSQRHERIMRGKSHLKKVWVAGVPHLRLSICSLSKMSMYHVFVCLESFRRSFLLAPSSDFIVDSWRCNGGPGCLSAFGGAGGGEKAATSLAKCLVGREEFLWP